MLHSDFTVSIDGDLAGVTVVQTFENPTRQPLNATYLFPLNEGAAVDAMTMQVGDQTIRAQIREREQARREYEQARDSGRAAALLTQHRPNMFIQQVANLMPGAPVRVTMHYMQVFRASHGGYELVVPLVVGPRYNPGQQMLAQQAVAGSDAPTIAGGWTIAPPPLSAASIWFDAAQHNRPGSRVDADRSRRTVCNRRCQQRHPCALRQRGRRSSHHYAAGRTRHRQSRLRLALQIGRRRCAIGRRHPPRRARRLLSASLWSRRPRRRRRRSRRAKSYLSWTLRDRWTASRSRPAKPSCKTRCGRCGQPIITASFN